MENTPQDSDDVNALESPDTDASGQENADSGGTSPKNDAGSPAPSGGGKKQKLTQRVQKRLAQLNIYLLVFIFIMVIAGVFVFVSIRQNEQELAIPELTPQELSEEALEEINENAIKVGDPKQTLSIESNAVFAGQVLVRGSLDVAGAIKVGGALNLPGITVSGTSNFDQIQANGLAVAGDSNIQGALNVQENLTVAGGATFGGAVSAPTLTAQSLQLSGDLTVTRHIDAGGGTPSRTNGTALGGGGTSSISGTDTAGTVSINTGSNPAAGCFASVTFAVQFNETPHVVITPVGSAAAAINYYITRTSTGFSICTTNPAPPFQNFAFDYVAID